jgi:hypothetical protein
MVSLHSGHGTGELVFFTYSYTRLCSSAAAENSTRSFHHASILSLRFCTSSNEPKKCLGLRTPFMKNTIRTQNCKRKKSFFLRKGQHNEIEGSRPLGWTTLVYPFPWPDLVPNGFSKWAKQRGVLPGLSPLHITQASWSRWLLGMRGFFFPLFLWFSCKIPTWFLWNCCVPNRP